MDRKGQRIETCVIKEIKNKQVFRGTMWCQVLRQGLSTPLKGEGYLEPLMLVKQGFCAPLIRASSSRQGIFFGLHRHS